MISDLYKPINIDVSNILSKFFLASLIYHYPESVEAFMIIEDVLVNIINNFYYQANVFDYCF